MTDLRETIAPKSDQLNADDLIGATRTITVTRVSRCSEPDQPIAINFDGDNGKPYKPCKSMRRVLVQCWGPDGSSYVGRSMTLYRDDKVQFGGVAVGGIRISHLSHIEREMTMALTATRANRKPFTVRPLKSPATAAPAPAAAKPSVTQWLDGLQGKLRAADSREAVDAILFAPQVQKALTTLQGDALDRLNAMVNAAIARHSVAETPLLEEDDIPFGPTGEVYAAAEVVP